MLKSYYWMGTYIANMINRPCDVRYKIDDPVCSNDIITGVELFNLDYDKTNPVTIVYPKWTISKYTTTDPKKSFDVDQLYPKLDLVLKKYKRFVVIF